HRRRDERAKACDDFARALDLDPDYDFARHSLAELHLGAGDPRAALGALDRRPGRASGWESALRITAHQAQGGTPTAAELFRALVRDPSADAQSIDRALQASKAERWRRAAETVLAETHVLDDSHPHASALAVAAAIERSHWQTARRRVT